MAVPVHTNRLQPVGFRYPDGFSTKIAFNVAPAVQIWEQMVKPPGVDGGEPIPVTTMLNVAYRQFRARHLTTIMPLSFSGMYDPDVYPVILSIVNVEGSITVFLPNGAWIDFYGYLQKFEPGDNKEGEPPTASVVIPVTNYDPISNSEQGPVFNAAGTV